MRLAEWIRRITEVLESRPGPPGGVEVPPAASEHGNRRKRAPRAILILGGSLLLMATAAAAGLAWLFCYLPYGSAPFPRQVTIPHGATLRTAASILHHEGLLRSPSAFTALATLRRDQGRIRAGEYRFDGPASPLDILERLTRGDVVLHRITFPEGWTLTQVAERLAADGLIDRARFLRKARDPKSTLDLLGFEAPSLEGFLFPETYLLPSGWDEDQILQAMVTGFRQAFDKTLQARAREIGWSILEVVTLASLIEKETALPDELPLVSGVFHRRLRLGMRLESDPSVIYALEGFDGNLRKDDLATPHPYNTYVITGLPPGPICNPGRQALLAALHPTQKGYLYFVSRNDGSHYFSRTYQEHLRAVARYQKSRTAGAGHRVQ